MGILKKVKGAVSSKANAALDAAIDPQKEMDLIIATMDEQRQVAIKELLSYKADAKRMEMHYDEEEKRAALWEKRAMVAVKKGDDEMAKECLERKRRSKSQMLQIKKDQLEAASYAAELNASRKTLELKLRTLKLKKGTLANQLAAARGTGSDPFQASEALFDKLEEAERQIDAEVFESEAVAELRGDSASKLLEDSAFEADGFSEQDDPLLALKAQMAGESKLLKE